MSSYTPDEAQIVAGYSHVAHMESQGMRSEADAAREARRGIAKIKADAIRDAVEHFEAHVGVEEFRDETRRDGTFWLDTDAVWEAQGPFMDWLRNRADRIERGDA